MTAGTVGLMTFMVSRTTQATWVVVTMLPTSVTQMVSGITVMTHMLMPHITIQQVEDLVHTYCSTLGVAY